MTIAGPMSGSIPPLQLPVRRRRLAELILAAIAGDAEAVRTSAGEPEEGERPGPAIAGEILVAEDVDINRDLICRQIEGLGFRARPARDGSEAVAAALEAGVEMVLMDMRMPGLDGIAATRRIRELEPAGRRVPIVAITANASEDDRRTCLEAGMDDHLAKPVRSSELLTMLDRWLGGAAGNGGSAKAAAPAQFATLAGELEALGADVGGEEAVSELIDRWRQELGPRLESLRVAVDRGDEEERERLAHALKGASGVFGVHGLTERCAALEKLTDPAAAALLLDDVEAEADALDSALAQWQGGRQAGRQGGRQGGRQAGRPAADR